MKKEPKDTQDLYAAWGTTEEAHLAKMRKIIAGMNEKAKAKIDEMEVVTVSRPEPVYSRFSSATRRTAISKIGARRYAIKNSVGNALALKGAKLELIEAPDGNQVVMVKPGRKAKRVKGVHKFRSGRKKGGFK